MAAPLQQLSLALLQWDVQPGDPDANLRRSVALIQQAAEEGAKLVVLPELCISGYHFSHKDEALALAEPPEGPTEQVWCEKARELDIAIAGGLAERRGEQLYNAMVFITQEGIHGRYHKTHLFDREKLFFTEGQQLSLLSWQGVPMGMMLCYDGWFPEVPRALTLAGAELILAPGCWHRRPPLLGDDLAPAHHLHMASAYNNSVFIACASRGGSEGSLQFAGQSALFGPRGLVAGPGPSEGDAIVHGQIDLRQARFKHRTKRVHPLKDRRPELYAALALPHR